MDSTSSDSLKSQYLMDGIELIEPGFDFEYDFFHSQLPLDISSSCNSSYSSSISSTQSSPVYVESTLHKSFHQYMDGTSNNTPTLQSNSKFEPITLFSNDNPNPPYLSTNFSNSTNQRILQSHYSFTQYNNDINDQNQYNFSQQNKDNIHYDQEQTHHSFTHHNNDINFDPDQTQYSFTNHNNHYKDEHLMPSPIITSTKIPQLPSNATTTPVNLKKPKKDYSNLEKKHNCDFCEKSFLRKHDKLRHVRNHLGIKPYHCHKCQKQFTRSDALTRHQLTSKVCKD